MQRQVGANRVLCVCVQGVWKVSEKRDSGRRKIWKDFSSRNSGVCGVGEREKEDIK